MSSHRVIKILSFHTVWVILVNSRSCKEIDLEAHCILMQHVDDAIDGHSIIADNCLMAYLPKQYYGFIIVLGNNNYGSR